MSTTMEQEVGQIPPVEGSSLGDRTTSLAVREDDVTSNGSIAAFASQTNFAAAQRIAKALASSSLVPKAYQGPNGVANCLVAMELASRTGASVLMVMQNLHVIQGRPSWSSAFLVASVNSCGRFSALRYEVEGTPGNPGSRCRAVARELSTRDLLYGEWITHEMAVAEGWTTKAGSKWKTMPGQMLRYRAAAFWVRVYAPEISLGMHAAEEVADIPERGESVSGGARELNDSLRQVVEAEATIVTATPVAPNVGGSLSGTTSNAQTSSPTLDGRTCSECGGRDGVHAAECRYYAD